MLMTNHVNYVFIHQELVIPRCSSGSPHRAVQASVGADAGTHILHTTPPMQCGSAPPRPASPRPEGGLGPGPACIVCTGHFHPPPAGQRSI